MDASMIVIVLYSSLLFGTVIASGGAGTIAEKRSHNHSPLWIDHCWDEAGTHNLDPFCQLIFDAGCTNPPQIENGYFKQPFDKHLGSKVTYVCNDGYTMVGPDAIQCERGNKVLQWSKPPTCIKTECMKEADVVFILDGSGSIGTDDFQKELAFVTNLVDRYPYATTHFGMLLFSNNIYRQFYLNEFTNDKTALIAKIQSTQYPSGGTNTSDALMFARTDMFTAAHGMRQGVSQIAIMVTDGNSANPNATSSEAALLRNAGVTIYSVGVGNADKAELNTISSNTNFVFFVDNFINISAIVRPLAEVTCEAGCGTPPRIDNGFYKQPRDTHVGSNVTYACAVGYTMVGPKVIQCERGDGTLQWTSPPTCVKTASCGTPPRIDNGFYKQPRESYVGSNVSYACAVGYTMVGPKVIQCERVDGTVQWTSPPTCVKTAVCNNPPPITNGAIQKPYDTLLGSRVNYVCNDGYTMVGPVAVRCEQTDDGTLQWTNQPTCNKKECRNPTDIVFIVDGSGSIGIDDFKKELAFVSNIVNSYTYATTQFGMLLFSTNISRQFYLNEFTNNKAALIEKIHNTTIPYGGTNTADALMSARSDMFTVDHGMRPNVSKIAIIVTDGKSADQNATVSEAELLRNAGVTIYSIGVGEADKTELNSISSNEKFVFFVDTFSNITSIAGPLAEVSCDIPSDETVSDRRVGGMPIVQ